MILPFRPQFWPTLITAFAVALTLALGIWQVQRLVWKQGLIDRLEQRLVAPPVSPPPVIDIAAMEYSRVRAEGRFLHQHEILLIGRTEKGSNGFHVVTPFAVEGGPVVLVNRGWIPDDRKDPARRPGSRPEGLVTVEGIIRRDAVRGYFTPPNEPARGFWFTIDAAEIGAFTGLGPLPAYYIDALRQPGPVLPIGADPKIALRNEHLQYAITWFSLAIAGAVIWWLYHRRRP